MSSVGKIENEFANLSSSELAKFRAWFEKYDGVAWDQQFENDVTSGKLDRLAEQAISDYKEGNSKEL